MQQTEGNAAERGQRRLQDDCAKDAAALFDRFSPADIKWLDEFLADYVFEGEPLDRVVLRARDLAGLARRSKKRRTAD